MQWVPSCTPRSSRLLSLALRLSEEPQCLGEQAHRSVHVLKLQCAGGRLGELGGLCDLPKPRLVASRRHRRCRRGQRGRYRWRRSGPRCRGRHRRWHCGRCRRGGWVSAAGAPGCGCASTSKTKVGQVGSLRLGLGHVQLHHMGQEERLSQLCASPASCMISTRRAPCGCRKR